MKNAQMWWLVVGQGKLAPIHEKIARCGRQLDSSGEENFSHIPNEIAKKQHLIFKLNKQEQSVEVIQKMKEVENELDELLKEEEIWWAQRTKANWIKHGDQNTKLFHQKVSQRKQRNWVDSIQDKVGVINEDEEEIEKVMNFYFPQLFTFENTENVEEIVEVVKGK